VKLFRTDRSPPGSLRARNLNLEADRCRARARRLLSRDERRTPMKNITRLALAFAVATIACLSPIAHADDEAQLVGSGIRPERYYHYHDKDGDGDLYVKDGPKYNGYRAIYVTLYQNGYVFSGKGWRSLASEETYWLAQCEFWLYGGDVKAKFEGYIRIKYNPAYPKGEGSYYLYGSGSPYYWECYLDND
jgi:hypothetical protein